tara:strand:+ start:1184 stop:3781 length:2598 start_codon:yes stop_codon:yes gene_type:complete
MTQQEFTERYQFSIKTDKIGGGSFGTVYRAYDTILDREVAIKISEVKFVGDKEFSLLEEYKAIENIPVHKCIANYEEVFRFESFNGIYDYGLMQYYALGNLSSYLKNNEVSLAKRESITKGILEGIAFLHEHKVVHRDLKPSNILVVDRRGEIIPKITDFGLSKQAEGDGKASRFTNSFAGGTLQYSSPEQLKGLPLKLNTDLWSFGAIAYEILTGKTLFEAQSQSTASAEWQNEITQKILHADISEQLTTLPSNWQLVVNACLERDVSERVQHAEALFAILDEKTFTRTESRKQPHPINDATFIKENPKEEPIKKPAPEKTTAPTPKKENPKWMLTALGVAVVLLLSAVGYFIVTASDSSTKKEIKLQIFESGGLYGYKLGDSIAIPARYTLAREFKEGMANVKTRDSSFYINTKGAWVVNPKIAKKETENTKKEETNKKKEVVKPAKKETKKQEPKKFIIDPKEISKYEISAWVKKGNNLKNTITAANNGNTIAQRRMGRINQFVYKNYKKAVELYKKAAVLEDASAQTSMGYMYHLGKGVTKDYAETLRWYRRAAAQGFPRAQSNLGTMYELGEGVEKDKVEAAEWYRKAAIQGYPNGQYNLGVAYAIGNGIIKDDVEAVKWYRKAAMQGYMLAQYNLGVMYINGRGVIKDDEEAVKWYRKAAEQGYAVAQSQLYYIYKNGKGVIKDYVEAIKWTRKLVDKGDAAAQFNLGDMYEKGQGVTKDAVEAMKWYRKSAEQGYIHAQYYLGANYAHGIGVEKNGREALKWLHKAVNQNGYTSAQNTIGEIYEKGLGVEKDYKEAIKWYKKAADKGEPRAQVNMGWMNEYGKGVTQNYEEALKWYQKAADQGNSYGKKGLSRVKDKQ